MSGDMTWDTCPFYFMALQRGSYLGASTSGSATVPGYFFVSYTYDLKNPIGSAWTYSSQGLSTFADSGVGYNVSGVLIEETSFTQPSSTVLGVGTILHKENEQWYHSDTAVTPSNTSGYLALFSCSQSGDLINSLTRGLAETTLALSEAQSATQFAPKPYSLSYGRMWARGPGFEE